MRIVIEKDDDEPAPDEDEGPKSTQSGTLISPVARTKVSQRPTRMMPKMDDSVFHTYVLGALAKAKTEKQKNDLRMVLERGLAAKLITQEACDEILLMLVRP
jgi:hypothetical protein